MSVKFLFQNISTQQASLHQQVQMKGSKYTGKVQTNITIIKLPAVPFFTHAVSFSKRRDFWQCFIILMLSSLMVVYSLASSMALSSIFSVIDG